MTPSERRTLIGNLSKYPDSCHKYPVEGWANAPDLSRAGKTWTIEEWKLLRDEYMRGETLAAMSLAHKRTCSALREALAHAGFICKIVLQSSHRYHSNLPYYYKIIPDEHVHPIAQPEIQPEEITMTKNIETKTLIAGQDAANMTDNEIFQKIAKLEAEVSKLQSIKVASKKLKAAVEALEVDIAKLVEYVDSRE